MKKQLLLFVACLFLSTNLFAGIINVSTFRQDGSSWGSNTLGTCSGCTLSSDGCAITCIAMLLKTNGVNIDPGVLNTYLKNNSGYAYNSSGCTGNCLIKWDVPVSYSGSSLTYPNLSTTFSLATVKGEIDNGNPVILQTKSGSSLHFVVIKGYNNNGTSLSDFIVVDPLKTGDQVLTNYSTDGVRIYRNVSANTPPALASPADNSQITKGNDIPFSWSNVANAAYYEIWIDNSNVFGSPEIGFNNGVSSTWLGDGIVSTNGFTLTSAWQNQLPQNVYYWKVRALNGNKVAITDWSSPIIKFSLLDKPLAPTLSSPADNSQITKGSDISFSWSTVATAAYYEIWIDNSNVFGSPEIGFNNGVSSTWLDDGIVSTNGFTLTSAWQNQLPQNVYYWKVRALNAIKVAITDWSSPTIKFSLFNNVSEVSRILDNNNLFNVYPTSSNDKIIIETSALIKEATIVIYNTKGQEFVRQTITSNKTQINISSLPSSTYLVKLMNGKNIDVKSFIKK